MCIGCSYTCTLPNDISMRMDTTPFVCQCGSISQKMCLFKPRYVCVCVRESEREGDIMNYIYYTHTHTHTHIHTSRIISHTHTLSLFHSLSVILSHTHTYIYPCTHRYPIDIDVDESIELLQYQIYSLVNIQPAQQALVLIQSKDKSITLSEVTAFTVFDDCACVNECV